MQIVKALRSTRLQNTSLLLLISILLFSLPNVVDLGNNRNLVELTSSSEGALSPSHAVIGKKKPSSFRRGDHGSNEERNYHHHHRAVQQEGGGCTSPLLLDFSTASDGTKITGGDYITDQFSGYGMLLDVPIAHGLGFGILGPRVFDSTNPTGNDMDLGSPNAMCSAPGPGTGIAGVPGSLYENCVNHGNLLIIQEEDKLEPDDSNDGGIIRFSFDPPVDVLNAGLLDLDGKLNTDSLAIETATISTESTSVSVPATGPNGFVLVPIDAISVTQMNFSFAGSGAIAELEFCLSKATAPVAPTITPWDALPSPVPTAIDSAIPTSDSPSQSPASSTDMPTITPSIPVSVPSGEPSIRPAHAFDCKFLDFDDLMEGEYITDQLVAEYGVRILVVPNTTAGKGYAPGGAARVFNTSNPMEDEDLGSPNHECPGGGPGYGLGGNPNSTFSNCDPLGMVLVIQESDKEFPDDSSDGGNITFIFESPVFIFEIGIFDIDDVAADTVEVLGTDEIASIIETRPTGENGFLRLDVDESDALQLTVIFPSSGSVAHLEYCFDPDARPDGTDPVISSSPSLTSPTTGAPSVNPPREPVVASSLPSDIPSKAPSGIPSRTLAPSDVPSALTLEPSDIPSVLPSSSWTGFPSVDPSYLPSTIPSRSPTLGPSDAPSLIFSEMPSTIPSAIPMGAVSGLPSSFPSSVTWQPSDPPSIGPSATQSSGPSEGPSTHASDAPSIIHSVLPSTGPSASPSLALSVVPSDTPSLSTSTTPTLILSSEMPSDGMKPSTAPSEIHSESPSDALSNPPSKRPSASPSDFASVGPTIQVSDATSYVQSNTPTALASEYPSIHPSRLPSDSPSEGPSWRPSTLPSYEPSGIMPTVLTSHPSLVPSTVPTLSCVNTKNGGGVDEGCELVYRYCGQNGAGINKNKEGNQCYSCENNVDGAGMDRGCTLAAPICGTATTRFPKTLANECFVCINDGKGKLADLGCDATTPLCLNSDASAIDIGEGGMGCFLPQTQLSLLPSSAPTMAPTELDLSPSATPTLTCVNTKNGGGVDEGCENLFRYCGNDGQGLDKNAPGNQCYLCENNKDDAKRDRGCSFDAPMCGNGVKRIPKTLANVCYVCVNNNADETPDVGCDSANPYCHDANGHEVDIGEGGMGCFPFFAQPSGTPTIDASEVPSTLPSDEFSETPSGGSDEPHGASDVPSDTSSILSSDSPSDQPSYVAA